MGAFTSFAKGYAGGYLLTSAVLDPRRTTRKLIAAVMFVGSVGMLYIVWLSTASDDGLGTIGPALMVGVVATFVLIVSVSKFVTDTPFSVFTYPQRMSASIDRIAVAKYWWFAVIGSFALTVLSAMIGGTGFAALGVTGVIVAGVGAGVYVAMVPKVVTAVAFAVRDQAARALGVHSETMEVANAGTLQKPVYFVRFPYLVEESELEGLSTTIAEITRGMDVVGIDREGVALVDSPAGK